MRAILAVILLYALPAHAESVVSADCALEGFALHGNVQIVDSFPDLKIEYVESFPGLP